MASTLPSLKLYQSKNILSYLSNDYIFLIVMENGLDRASFLHNLLEESSMEEFRPSP